MINYISREAHEIKECKVCHKQASTDVKIFTCSRCKISRYCSTNCQKQDWSNHKTVCHKANTVIIPNATTASQKTLKKANTYLNSFIFTYGSPSEITEEQKLDAQAIIDIKDVNSILDQGITEAHVKNLGQQIFDKYKNRAENFEAGRKAVKDICNWIRANALQDQDKGALRAEFLEYAWDGIGDNNWRWRP